MDVVYTMGMLLEHNISLMELYTDCAIQHDALIEAVKKTQQ